MGISKSHMVGKKYGNTIFHSHVDASKQTHRMSPRMIHDWMSLRTTEGFNV